MLICGKSQLKPSQGNVLCINLKLIFFNIIIVTTGLTSTAKGSNAIGLSFLQTAVT